MNLKRLNNIILDEYNVDPYTVEDLQLIESFLKIIRGNTIYFDILKYKEKTDLDKSIDYSLDFIESVDPKYREIIEDAINQGLITYNYDNNSDALSKLYLINGKKNINFVVTNTIGDSYTFTHEGFHYINVDLNKLPSNWWLMTETISMTAETLQKMYFEKNNLYLPEYKYNEINNYCGIIEKSYMLDFETQLLKEFLNGRKITEDTMYNILNNQNDDYIYLACMDYEEMMKTGYMNYSILQRYIISAVLSSRLLKIIQKDNSYKQFIELNDNCNDMEFSDTLKYLGLKLKDDKKIILSDESLNELNTEYFEKVLTLKK